MWTLSGFSDEISPDLEEQCALVRKLGMTHLEFRSAWGTNVLDLDDGQLARAKKILDAHGLQVSSIGSPIGKISIDEDFDTHLDRARHAVDVAHHFGARYIRIFSFFIPDGENPDDHRDEVLRRMTALARVAEHGERDLAAREREGDLRRHTAPLRRHPRYGGVAEPAGGLGRRQLRPGRCAPHTEGFAALRPYLEYVQIKDAQLSTGEVVAAGRGDGEMVDTIRALRQDGYDGFFSLEPHLSQTHSLGGFSGPDLFTEAWQAFTDLLKAEDIPYQ